MAPITMMTGATAWHYFGTCGADDDADPDAAAAADATPAAVIDALRRRRRRRQHHHTLPPPVLLLLHANGFGAATYEPLARSLRSHLADNAELAGAPLLAPDMPGQGSSRQFPAALGRPLTAPRFAAWLLSALAAQGLVDGGGGEAPVAEGSGGATTTIPNARARIFCFGHSGGAATALVAEALRPGTFAAIFAYEPVEAPPAVREAQARDLMFGKIGNKGEPLARMARKRRAAFDGGRAAARLSLGGKPPFRELHPEVLDLYVRTQMETQQEADEEEAERRRGGLAGRRGAGAAAAAAEAAAAAAAAADDLSVRLKCAPEVEAEYFQAFSRPPHAWQFERVRCPVALACGGAPGGGLGGSLGGAAKQGGGKGEGPHDALAAWAPLTARALPRGEMTPPFARLGHLGPLEDPEAVGAAAAAFFSRAAAAGEEGGGAGGGGVRSRL